MLRRGRHRRLAGFSLNRMIPNVLTLLALCAGMTAIRFAITGKYEAAVVSIIIAGIFDGLDGRAARMLKSSSAFGAQLDSLSDFISFGVAPAVLLYIWTLAQLASFGWAVAVFFAICCSLRLARFNSELNLDLPAYAQKFFTGVPAPGGAGIAILPLIVEFEYPTGIFRYPFVTAVVVVLAAALMVSRIPTLSFKRIRLPHNFVVPTLLGIGIIAAFFATAPWPTLAAVGLAYLASIPFTVRSYNRMKKAAEAAAPVVPPAASDGLKLIAGSETGTG